MPIWYIKEDPEMENFVILEKIWYFCGHFGIFLPVLVILRSEIWLP
jgi:hypothetical protein